jgi:biopolymer transport protein ExbB
MEFTVVTSALLPGGQASQLAHTKETALRQLTRRWFLALLFLLTFGLAVGGGQALAQPAGSQAADQAAEPIGEGGPTSKAPQGFFEIVFSGGPIGVTIMICLIGLSMFAAYLIFDQLITLRRGEILPDGLSDSVRELVAARRLHEADQACRQQPSLLAFVLLHGLGEWPGGWTAVEKGLEDALAEQSARLFRRVEYLSVIGNIAPMMGLLGTVVGMIMAFETVASTQGSAGAPDLAEGIYEALVTTVAGLVIAIPSLGAFAIFRNRVDELAAEAAYQAQHALAPLKHPSPVGSSPPPPPPEGPR